MKSPAPKLARCAIYTRKSTEHNLDLAFNSLDAQREACETRHAGATNPEIQKWAAQTGPPNAPNAGICCLSSLAADAGRAANSRQGPRFLRIVSHWHRRII